MLNLYHGLILLRDGFTQPFQHIFDTGLNTYTRNLPEITYRGENKGLSVLLSRTQAGPGRTVKQEQEEISRNHVQTFIFLSAEK